MKKLITTLATLFAACSCMLAQETETHNHWEWEVTMPVDGWRVSNALSSMGVYKNGTNIEFDVKDWKDSSIEASVKYAEMKKKNRKKDIVIDGQTWVVYTQGTKWEKFDITAYTFDPSRKMVVRIGAKGVTDPNDPDFLLVLKGLRIVPKQ